MKKEPPKPKTVHILKKNSFNNVLYAAKDPKAAKAEAATELKQLKEYREQAAKMKLTELIEGYFISESSVDRINWLMENCRIRSIGRKIVVTKNIQAAEVKLTSGLILSSTEFDGKFSGKHGTELPESRHPSAVGIVLSVGDGVGYNINRGDIVRFSPMSASEFNMLRHNAYFVYEEDVQGVEGSILAPQKFDRVLEDIADNPPKPVTELKGNVKPRRSKRN